MSACGDTVAGTEMGAYADIGAGTAMGAYATVGALRRVRLLIPGLVLRWVQPICWYRSSY
eukprot:984789-Rhodomonas_salina.1